MPSGARPGSCRRRPSDGAGRLTGRELEVATLAALGRSTKEIADRMYLSPRTIENHLHHAYVKLGVSDTRRVGGGARPGAERLN